MTDNGMPRELISTETLQRRIDELAAEIERDYADSRDLLCVGVLKGSVFFLTDLVQRLSRPLVVDFFQTSSYRGETTSHGEVRIRRDLDHSLAGRDVLLIEDIVDTGYTMRTIMALMGFPWRPFGSPLRTAGQGVQAGDSGPYPLSRLRGR